MSAGELTILLPLAAACLWLGLFLFMLLDHLVYRGTYGHFLLGLDAIERRTGASSAGVAAVRDHMRRAKTRDLARYLSNAASSRGPAQAAAEAYIERIGLEKVLARAAASRWRGQQVTALYAVSRTSQPAVLPLLETALASRQPVLAYAALDMLDVHGSNGAAEVLLRALDAGVLPASRIATHLEYFPIDLTDLYVAWLDGGAPKSRYWIAYLLGKSRYSERSEAILAALLSDPAADVRKIALASLAALDAPRLREQAPRMLDDPVFFVRTQAARILARFPEPGMVHALARHLGDDNDAVQLAVKRTLVELGPVTLEHLPPAGPLLDPSARETIAQITNTIRSASADSDALRGAGPALESTHA
ncbi:HEAT repeat domain-containing protein [Lysobacter humi (ex Lee et al. 2017)]